MSSILSSHGLRAAAIFSLWTCVLSNSFAQGTAPSNNTAAFAQSPQFLLSTTLNNMKVQFPVEPLSDQAGLSGSLSQLQQIFPSGPLFLTTSQNINAVQPGYISYISCEPSDYTSGNIDATTTVVDTANAKPAAIVLYSEFAASCSFQWNQAFSFNLLYTMIDANSSQAVIAGLKAGNPSNPTAGIRVNQTSVNNGTNSNDGNAILGKSPTTAVAMIILYSITGIITALFLIIIIVGAIRAHRHPERYGPRRVIGRPRQSRAKGIARAMLETLPIVKFGDKEDDKPDEGQNRDVELAATGGEDKDDDSDRSHSHNEGGDSPTTAAQEPHSDGTEAATNPNESAEGTKADDSDKIETVPAEDAVGTKTLEKKQTESANPIDDGLACSVCTDDFIKGQDIRLLPCKHKFHPECIDPWLLNVSGTCPLCRIDLAPAQSHEDSDHPDDEGPSLELRGELADEAANEEAGAPQRETRRNRRSRILSSLNIRRMRHATPQERLEVLRTLRAEGMTTTASGPRADAQGQERDESLAAPTTGLNRFSRRFSRALGGGSSRPSSWVQSRRTSYAPPNSSNTTEIPSTSGALPPSESTSPPNPSEPATDADEEPHNPLQTIETGRELPQTSTSSASPSEPEAQQLDETQPQQRRSWTSALKKATRRRSSAPNAAASSSAPAEQHDDAEEGEVEVEDRRRQGSYAG